MRAFLLAAAAAALSTAAHAYGHSFTNATAAPLELRVRHLDCGEDTMLVAPGQTIQWRSGLCCIESLEAAAPKATPARVRGKKAAPEPELPPMKAAIALPVCVGSNWKTGTGDSPAIVRN